MSDYVRLHRRVRLLALFSLALAALAVWGWVRPTAHPDLAITPPTTAEELEDLRDRMAGANRGERLRLIHALGQTHGVRAVDTLLEALRNARNDRVRGAVITQLGQLGTPAAVAELIEIARGSRTLQVRAISALGAVGTEPAVESLLQLLREPVLHPHRYAVIQALGDTGAERAVAALTDLAGNKLDPTRTYAIIALGATGDATAFGTLNDLLNTTDDRIRNVAVSALGELGSPKAKQTLLGLLGGKDRRLHATVIQALANYRDRDVQLLLAKQAEHPDEETALGALHALGAIDPAIPEDVLEGALQSRHRRVREAAVYALAEANTPEARAHLVELLADPQTAKAAVWALGRVPDGEARAAVLATLKTSSDPQVQRAAMHALSDATDSELPGLLTKFATSGRSALAAQAVQLIAQRQGKNATGFLLERFENGDRGVRSAALNALTSIDHPRAHELFQRLATSGDAAAQGNVLRALRQSNAPDAQTTLRQLLQSAHGTIRTEAAGVLARQGDTHAREVLFKGAREGDYGATWELTRGGDPGVRKQLFSLLTDDTVSPQSKQQIVGIMASQGTPEQLAAAASHQDTGVASAALQALGNQGGPQATRLLGSALSSGEPERRRAALNGLRSIGSPEAIDLVGRALDNETTFDQAATVLAQTGGKQAMSLLTGRFASASDEQRRRIVDAIPSGPGSHGRALLEAALDDSDEGVAVSAARALGQLGDRRLVPRLLGLMQSSDSARLRQTIASAIRANGGPTYESHKGLVDALLKESS